MATWPVTEPDGAVEAVIATLNGFESLNPQQTIKLHGFAAPNPAASPVSAVFRIRRVGDRRALWGTDAIWYGSPQAQIQVFRAFPISPESQVGSAVPALDPVLKRASTASTPPNSSASNARNPLCADQ